MARQISTPLIHFTDLHTKHSQAACKRIREQEATIAKTDCPHTKAAIRNKISGLRDKLRGLHYAFEIIEEAFTVAV